MSVNNIKEAPIFTEKTKCRDCYKCVRNCPVKAIKVEDNSARIIHENCIYCGRCVYSCPAEAKKVRNDVGEVKAALASEKKVILSMAPTWSSGLFGSLDELIGTFKNLGFNGVSETALGAQMVSGEVANDLVSTTDLTVSSACPSVVELFKKYYPRYMDSLSSYRSPLGVHAAWLKEIYGDDTVIVFAGPCIAKKLEADSDDSAVDYALTFDEITKWLEEDKHEKNLKENEFDSFIPFSAAQSTLYALEGGMIESVKEYISEDSTPMIPISGVTHIIDAMTEINCEDNIFLELLSCPGGCVNGSGCNSREKQFSFRKKSQQYYNFVNSSEEKHHDSPKLDRDKMLLGYGSEDLVFSEHYSDEQIQRAMVELGKENKEELLNCGGCGYNSCNDFAIAYLRGMGEKQMCVTTMRKRAQKKVDMILKTLPMGVVIVNSQMNIVEYNCEFVKLISEIDFEPDVDFIQNFIDLPINRYIDITSQLNVILSAEKSLFQERIKYKNQFLRVSFFSIEKQNLAGVIFQDITSTSMKREIVIKKAEEVINKNLQNVQQIASLLGENAAETEIILRSLTDPFQFTTPEVD